MPPRCSIITGFPAVFIKMEDRRSTRDGVRSSCGHSNSKLFNPSHLRRVHVLCRASVTRPVSVELFKSSSHAL